MTTLGDDGIDTLLIDVRASTQGFQQDIRAMRGAVDGSLVDGFARAGSVLERGLLSALRNGSLGFDDLKRVALGALDEIASQALRTIFSGVGGSGGLFDLGGIVGSVLGLPGRATGGNVSPGRGYVVGEDGPELFVPTAAGRIETRAAEPRGDDRRRAAGSQAALRLPLGPFAERGGPVAPPAVPPSAPREVRVSINVVTPDTATTPRALQRSSRQVASAVRRAMAFG